MKVRIADNGVLWVDGINHQLFNEAIECKCFSHDCDFQNFYLEVKEMEK